jgi:hypothetical protein
MPGTKPAPPSVSTKPPLPAVADAGLIEVSVAAGLRLVRLKVVEAAPLVAVTLYAPAVPLAVNEGEVALPAPLVLTVAGPPKMPLAPLPGALNVTGTPTLALPNASVTVTLKGVGKAVLMSTLCPPPPVAVIRAGAPTLLVRLNVAEAAPLAAVTVYAPATVLALNVGEVALPLLSVFTGLGPPKVPLAPLPGAENVTGTAGVGLPKLSTTFTLRGAAKAVLTVALWLLPPMIVIVAGAPAVLVRPKLVLSAPALALTL